MKLPVAGQTGLHQAQPPVRGDRGLRVLDRWLQALLRTAGRAVPPELNPLEQTGAIANVCLLVALATGALLLFWYSSSVHDAYASVAAMERAWLPGLVRSLHRYSSDGCMLFVLVHALRLTAARRITGARWLAWVTGCTLLALLVAVGWTGYWLVWDQRGHGVALGTARILDALPIFSEPLARSFLTDAGINSLLFFVVFFVHMLLPCAMGVALWLHISNTSRARFLTARAMTLWVLGTLLAVSLLLPATSAEPAQMAELPQRLTMDWWYLAPLVLTDRLGGGALWALLLFVGVAGTSAPWWMRRRSVAPVVPATTDPPRCKSCNQCFIDCPYEAISMVPRTDGRDLPTQAQVDPSRCVGCGICTGSCDTLGVGLLDTLHIRDERRRIEGWLKAHEGPAPSLAFVCAESGGRGLQIDPETGRCPELPGYLALSIPCLGWVNAVIVDRALERGAANVLMVGCGPGACSYREGVQFTHERMGGTRQPISRAGASSPRLQILEVYAGQEQRVKDVAAALRAGQPAGERTAPRGPLALLGGLLLALVLGGATWLGSDLPYAGPTIDDARLVVSFKHLGQMSEASHTLSAEELAQLPAHMRPAGGKTVSERRRADVRLRVAIDGEVVLERSFPPGGFWRDKTSVALEELEIAPGRHRVSIAVGDTPDLAEWGHLDSREVEFTRGRRRVVLFEQEKGFTWH